MFVNILNNILSDAKNVPHTISYKLKNNLLILNDEEEACKKPKWAYLFALDVPGANIGKCQEAVCKDPYYAYCFAFDIPGADIEKCQEAACKDSWCAYMFAKYIPGADIEKYQEVACLKSNMTR
ncbi:MAG: hypothetical protein WC942_05135 [Clostridia bacterium]|jgi:hypothetical protein